ncbi:unnamed protein product [Moneuplotes crassus]|uniref:UBR-type domain-containing protein n=1 Tax=Euplotes crassus TaxID=5936 RepID=A0AAD1UJ96_EUPCR|nr:unnamed protein product [Moneuplotes crassus]
MEKTHNNEQEQEPEAQEESKEANKKTLEELLSKCTYDRGYINQELYACETCYKEKEDDQDTNEPNQYGRSVEPAGICLPCLVSCHQDHKVYEIWRKTNFRCDCGNLKFNSECTLNPDKDPLNDENSYNHNFYGKYCHCDEKYNGEDEMYQCTYCEDWFHPKCLKPDITVKLAASDTKNDLGWKLICRKCCKKLENFQCKSSKDMSNLDTKEAMNQSESFEKTKITRKRKRNELPAQEDPQQDLESSEISADSKRFKNDENPTLKKEGTKETKSDQIKEEEEKKEEYEDRILFESIREHLCKCKSGRCHDLKEKFLSQVNAVENIPEDEQEISKALLEEKHSHFRIQELLEEPTATATSGSAKISTESEVFTDIASTNYPNVTPMFRQGMLEGLKETIRKVLDHAIENTTDSTPCITETDVEVFMEKVKSGDIKLPHMKKD